MGPFDDLPQDPALRTYYGVHPDDARFPWMEVDWDRCWRSDRLVAMLRAYQRSRRGERPAGNEAEIWQPHWAPRGHDPHDLEGDDYWAEMAATQGRPGPIERALAARAMLPGAFLERLEERPRLAESTSAQIPFPLGDEIFWMAAHGWGYYRYCLEHPDGRVGITPSRHLPSIRVQPRSEFLHTLGPVGAADRFASTLASECGEFVFTVSWLDLYADFEGWDLQAEDRSRFVCRADSVRTYEVEGQLTGIEFGKRSSGTVSARIYPSSTENVGWRS